MKARLRLTCFAVMLLTLWLGGAGCVLCCASETLSEYSAAKDIGCSRTASDQGSCCKIKKNKPGPARESTFERKQMSCALFAKQIEALTQWSTSPVPLFESVNDFQAFHLEPIALRERDSRASNHPPNRGSTYLQCCVLLI